MREKNKELLEKDNELGTQQFSNSVTLKAQIDSLKTKGFLRAYQPYTPPDDVLARLVAVCSETLGMQVDAANLSGVRLIDMDTKFAVLNALAKEFNYAVHNSQLSKVKSLKDVLLIYQVSEKFWLLNLVP